MRFIIECYKTILHYKVTHYMSKLRETLLKAMAQYS
jgi:hypothetical protein